MGLSYFFPQYLCIFLKTQNYLDIVNKGDMKKTIKTNRCHIFANTIWLEEELQVHSGSHIHDSLPQLIAIAYQAFWFTVYKQEILRET